jgi:hypothetical protein
MRNVLILLTFGAISTWTGAQYQPLNVKTGQWQTTVVANSGGSLAMPADYMAKLTPEQRTKVEAAMKEMSKPRTITRTNQDCLTQEELNRGTPFKPDDKQCTQKVLASSSSQLKVEQDCAEDSITTRTVMSLQAANSESVNGTGTVTVSSEGHTYTSKINFSSKWLASSCTSKNKDAMAPRLKDQLSAPDTSPATPSAPR